MFVEMDELMVTEKDLEWQETARWIKYEEDVEQGGNRWGRPHLAALSFLSLMNLRRCLERGNDPQTSAESRIDDRLTEIIRIR